MHYLLGALLVFTVVYVFIELMPALFAFITPVLIPALMIIAVWFIIRGIRQNRLS